MIVILFILVLFKGLSHRLWGPTVSGTQTMLEEAKPNI